MPVASASAAQSPNTSTGRSPPLSLNSSRTEPRNGKSAPSKTRAGLGTPKTSPAEPRRRETLKFPMNGDCAAKAFKNQLSQFEHAELAKLQEVYFLGLLAQKTKPTAAELHNYGFDDDKGDYRAIPKDHIAYRYEVLEVIGRGSFGQVFRVHDHKEHSDCALKVVKNRATLREQAQREVRILKFVLERDHSDEFNVVRLLDSFEFRGHLCLTFELLGSNLFEHLKRNAFQGVSDSSLRKVATQVLTSLKALHRMSVIHCDIKPENILFRPQKEPLLKLIDFGSSCFASESTHKYIQSLYYRAPEVTLGLPFTAAVDIWSLGCVLAELHAGLPLFPADSEREQLQRVIALLGPPPAHMTDEVTRFIGCAPRGSSEKCSLRDSLRDVLKKTDECFLSFLERCLQWDATLRITAEDALRHEWPTALRGKLHKHAISVPDIRSLLHRIQKLRPPISRK